MKFWKCFDEKLSHQKPTTKKINTLSQKNKGYVIIVLKKCYTAKHESTVEKFFFK